MAREIVTVGSDMLVEDAAKLLAYHNISGMPVEDPDGKVVGIVSEADVIGHIGAIVSDVMTEDVISVGEEATVEEIATLLATHRIKRVPVMDGGRCGGWSADRTSCGPSRRGSDPKLQVPGVGRATRPTR